MNDEENDEDDVFFVWPGSSSHYVLGRASLCDLIPTIEADPDFTIEDEVKKYFHDKIGVLRGTWDEYDEFMVEYHRRCKDALAHDFNNWSDRKYLLEQVTNELDSGQDHLLEYLWFDKPKFFNEGTTVSMSVDHGVNEQGKQLVELLEDGFVVDARTIQPSMIKTRQYIKEQVYSGIHRGLSDTWMLGRAHKDLKPIVKEYLQGFTAKMIYKGNYRKANEFVDSILAGDITDIMITRVMEDINTIVDPETRQEQIRKITKFKLSAEKINGVWKCD